MNKYMNDKISLTEYLNKQYLIYSHSIFRFGEYHLFLKDLATDFKSDLHPEVIKQLNYFFVCSNLLDDIMDNDNKEIKRIYNLNDEFPIYLKNVLSSIEKGLSKKEYSVFINYASNSLHYQNIESQSRLTIETTENDYFSLYIKRSVLLLQAAVPFNSESSLNSLYTSTKYLAYFGQIKNDIANLRKSKSSDLLNSRPTLPLIKVIEYANKQKNEEIINLIFSINKESYNKKEYDRIIRFIYENDILEHCAKLALYFFDKARKELLFHFSEKKEYIDYFFSNLIIRDD